jgi:hypothetical protein
MKRKSYVWSNEIYQGDDYSEIESLRSIFVDLDSNTSRRSISKDYYRRKLKDNPEGEGVLHVIKVDSKIVGMLSLTPKTFTVRGKQILSAELGDAFINPKYNQRGMFNSLLTSTLKTAADSGYEFIYGTPNDLALPGERKAGYEIINSVHLKSMVYAVSPWTVFDIKSKGNVKKRFLKIPLKLAGIFMKAYIYIRSSCNKIFYSSEGIHVQSLSQCPGDLFEHIQQDDSHFDIKLQRNATYLNWRFIDNIDKYLIYGVKKKEKTIGYFILKIGIWEGAKVGYIADYYVMHEEKNAFILSLDYMIKVLLDNDVDMIATWSVSKNYFHKYFKRNLFIKVKDVPVICFKNELGLSIINSEMRWHFTMADSDNI